MTVDHSENGGCKIRIKKLEKLNIFRGKSQLFLTENIFERL